MKMVLFGATGMVGQGLLRACLRDPGVERVLAVGRTPTGVTHDKLEELTHHDFTNFTAVEGALTGWDACAFCLGVSAAGMSEADYRRVTYDFALAAATTLARLNPGMTFMYVSGQGTDSAGRSRMMWARVKGETENALLELPFKAAYMLRPGFIYPVDGVVSKTALYRAVYAVVGPVYPALARLAPSQVITTDELGRAMIAIAARGADRPVLERADLARIAAA